MKEKEIKTFSGKIIYDALQKSSYDVEGLAERLDLSAVAIYNWFNGKRIIRFDNAQSICSILNIDESELTEAIKKDKMNLYDTKMSEKTKPKAVQASARINIEFGGSCKLTAFHQVPILGQVPAGQLQEILPKMRNEADEWELIPDEGIANPELLFGLHVVGESMIGKDIQDGDVIIIDTSIQPSNGDVVVAMVNDSATVKTFYRTGDILTLQSANAKIDPIVLRDNDKDSIKIIGKVIRVIKKL